MIVYNVHLIKYLFILIKINLNYQYNHYTYTCDPTTQEQ